MIFSGRYAFKNPDKVPNSLFKYDNEMYTDKVYRLHSWLKGNAMPPFKVIIVPTNRCNLKCYCCPNSFARQSGRFRQEDELSDREWHSVVDEALLRGVKEFYILGGGEPMLRRGLVIDIIRKIKRADTEYVTEIITNGTLFKEEDYESLVKLRHNRLLFSIDGCDPETHDYVRGVPGAFQKASSAARRFRETKKRLGADKPVLQMNTVISNRNYNRIADIVRFAIDAGFNDLALHPMREYEETRDGMQHLKLTRDQEQVMYQEIEKGQRISEGTGLFFNVSMVEETKKMHESQRAAPKDPQVPGMHEPAPQGIASPEKKEETVFPHCFEPFYSIFIDPKGNYNYCCAAGDGTNENNIRIGLKNAWNSPFLRDVRDKMLAHRLTEKCINCGLLDMNASLKKDVECYKEYIHRKRP